MAQMGQSLAGRPAGGLVAVAFALLASGFLVKAAVVPWHFWLPDAYGTAPAPACVLLAGVTQRTRSLRPGPNLGDRVLGRGERPGRAPHPLGPRGVRDPHRPGRHRHVARGDPPPPAVGLRRRGPYGPLPARFLAAAHRRAGRGGAARCRRRADQSRALPRSRRPPPAPSAHGRAPIAGQGPAMAVAAGVVVLGALALADLPPFASSVGKDLLAAAAGAARPLVEVVFAVTVVGSSAAILAATGRVWRGETTDHLSPAEEASGDPDRSRDHCAAGGTGTAAPRRTRTGPGTPPRRSRCHHRRHLRRQEWICRAVLAGTHATIATTKAPAGTLAPACWTSPRLPQPSSSERSFSCTTDCARRWNRYCGLRHLHSGHVGDQVTWAVFGSAVLAALSGIAFR